MLFLILVFTLYVVLWSLPLYFCVNWVLWLFHIAFRITLIQAIGVSVLISLITNFYNNKEKK